MAERNRARYIQRQLEAESESRPSYQWCLGVVRKWCPEARRRAVKEKRPVNEILLECARDEIARKKLRDAALD